MVATGAANGKHDVQIWVKKVGLVFARLEEPWTHLELD